jgi:hypothetical protein
MMFGGQGATPEYYYDGPVSGPIPRKLFIEAVTVCVDYSDFLAYSMLFNKPQFDRWVVVTSPTDEATRRLCEYHDIEYVVTTSMYGQEPTLVGHGKLYKPPFAKGDAINDGLAVLERTGWVVHIDADIVLPPRARDMIELAGLDDNYIYGIDRLMSKSFNDWATHVTYPELSHDANIFVRGNTFPFNVRVVKHRQAPPLGGYCPIGFFQMWHPNASGAHTYPTRHNTAGRTDMLHADRWPRSKRGIIPEIIGIHLESEEVHMGQNWEGRRTRYFGPHGLHRHQVQHAKDEWL